MARATSEPRQIGISHTAVLTDADCLKVIPRVFCAPPQEVESGPHDLFAKSVFQAALLQAETVTIRCCIVARMPTQSVPATPQSGNSGRETARIQRVSVVLVAPQRGHQVCYRLGVECRVKATKIQKATEKRIFGKP